MRTQLQRNEITTEVDFMREAVRFIQSNLHLMSPGARKELTRQKVNRLHEQLDTLWRTSLSHEDFQRVAHELSGDAAWIAANVPEEVKKKVAGLLNVEANRILGYAMFGHMI